jgi:hypothetical protein
MYQIANSEPQPPSAYRPGIPKEVDAIAMRAMARERNARYPTWEEMSHDLAGAFRGERLRAQKAQEFADTDKFEALRRLPFFQAFSNPELWEVARISSWRRAAKGETLMKEGEAGDYFCILAQGEVKVTKKGTLLNVLRAGESFGEMAYLSRKDPVRVADVTVSADADIIAVPSGRLAQASDGCRGKFDRAFMALLVERLAMANLRLSGV